MTVVVRFARMARAPATLRFAVIGDIHGRIGRVDSWIVALERALGHKLDFALSVGDVEAFATAEAHLRKATKGRMPAEFVAYASGEHAFPRPLYFIGGNNEDFAALHTIPEGGTLAANVHYLGRVGTQSIDGLKLAWLSGIHAPRFLDAPIAAPRTKEAAKQAGYFRAKELAALREAGPIDVLLLHEWPRGLVLPARARARGESRTLAAYRFPWIGNAHARALVDALAPPWVFCGHSHVAFASTVSHADGSQSNVVCLDQTARPEGSVVWVEWAHGRAKALGWGIDGEVAWRDGEPWDERNTPTAGA